MSCGMQVHIELAVEQRLGLILRQGCRPFDGALELLQRHLDTAVFARPGGSVKMTGFDRPGKTGILDRSAKRPGCGVESTASGSLYRVGIRRNHPAMTQASLDLTSAGM